jgi:hypothetical protein
MLVFFELGLQKCIVMADPFETRFAAQRDIVSVPPTAMQCARGRRVAVKVLPPQTSGFVIRAMNPLQASDCQLR